VIKSLIDNGLKPRKYGPRANACSLSVQNRAGFLPCLAIFSKAWEIHPVIKIEVME